MEGFWLYDKFRIILMEIIIRVIQVGPPWLVTRDCLNPGLVILTYYSLPFKKRHITKDINIIVIVIKG
jgi:hypothetical protein